MFAFHADDEHTPRSSDTGELKDVIDLASRPVGTGILDSGEGLVHDAHGTVWNVSDFQSRARPPKAKMIQPARIRALRDLLHTGRQCKNS